jgi:phage tail sheath protein FI
MNNSGSILTDGALGTGSVDNVRWEVTDSNENLGTFSLIVRRGDDNHKSKIILETWNDLSLDPKSDRYVAKVIGDVSYSAAGGILTEVGDNPNRSAYIRVSAVNGKTPDYFNNAGVKQYTGKLPLVGSGSIGGAFKSATGDLWEAGQQALYFDAIGTNLTTRNTEGLDATGKSALDFNEAIALLANTEEFNFDVLLTPGLNHADHTITVDKFIDLVQKRGDAIYVTDLTGHGDALSTVTAEAQGLNSSFAAAYWPWVKVQAQGVGKQVWVGASAVMGGVYAFNDSVSDQWFAPAGLVRGGIPGVVRTERKLSRADRDTLYVSKVNPLATFPGQGVVAYGQKTLQTKASALDRVNVRRLLINLKRFIGGQADNLVFEQNSIATRNRFLSAVNPYLDLVVQREGLYAYRVVMDDTNNTADVIDRNQLVGQIYIQPTKTAEFIVLDFVVQPTGASFGA